MAYQYNSCSPRKAKREVIYFRSDVRIRQTRAGAQLWLVELLNDSTGTFYAYNSQPETAYDAECRARYVMRYGET